MAWLAVLLAALAGALNPFQATNAELYKYWRQPVWATLWVYTSGLLIAAVVQLFLRNPLPASSAVHASPWWAYIGGPISVATTLIGLMFAQRLGSGMFTGITVTGSVLVSILLDQLGAIGFRQHTASPLRLLGGALMVCGVWLVSRF